MEYLNELPIYEVRLNDETDGVFMMSIVDTPAVDSNFLKFNKQKPKIVYKFNEEKQIVTGVALRADYPILRCVDNEYFYVKFTADEIEKIAYKFMKEKKLSKVNIDHLNDVEDIYLIESYILDSKHQINEFKDIEVGSWIVSYKVENKEVWESIKKGKLNGFSVEINASLESSKLTKVNEILKILESYEH